MSYLPSQFKCSQGYTERMSFVSDRQVALFQSLAVPSQTTPSEKVALALTLALNPHRPSPTYGLAAKRRSACFQSLKLCYYVDLYIVETNR